MKHSAAGRVDECRGERHGHEDMNIVAAQFAYGETLDNGRRTAKVRVSAPASVTVGSPRPRSRPARRQCRWKDKRVELFFSPVTELADEELAHMTTP